MNTFHINYRPPAWLLAFSLSALVAGCGGGSSPVTHEEPPVVDQAGGVCTGAECVNLRSAGTFVILSRAAITNVPTSPITGNVGAHPIDGASIGVTCAEVSGTIYDREGAYTGGGAPDVTCRVTDDALLATAITNTGLAFAEADAKTPGVGNDDLFGGNLTGEELLPGVYFWSTPVSVDAAGAVTLTGGPTDVWVFQLAEGLTMGSGSTVTLAGGALPKNIFWRTGAAVALGTTAHLEGIVLSGTSVTLATGATVNGRLLASTSVTLDANTVRRPD